MTKEDMKKEIMNILNDIDDSIDYASEEHLIDDHIFDSFMIISLVSELEDAFDVRISAADMIASNFNSVDEMADMILHLQK